MNFRSKYDDHQNYYSNTGSRLHPIYQAKVDDEGRIELVETGQENIYEMIQSHKDSVDIHVLLKQFAQGDAEALMRRQAMYTDLVNLPKTHAEMLQTMIDAENYFNTLPVETRARFGHSFQQFIAGMEKSDFAEKMGWSTPASAVETAAQVVQEGVVES